MSKGKNIVLGVTGSIAAYKAAELVRTLMKEGSRVSVVMTESATKYVGALTFQALTNTPVAVGRFETLPSESYQHINLGQHADVIAIAPCTANVLAKLANGWPTIF